MSVLCGLGSTDLLNATRELSEQVLSFLGRSQAFNTDPELPRQSLNRILRTLWSGLGSAHIQLMTTVL